MIKVSNKSLKGLETIIKARKKFKTKVSETRETNKIYISIGEEVTFSVINQPMNIVISTSDNHSSAQSYIIDIDAIKDLKVNKSLDAVIDTDAMEMLLSNGERIKLYEISDDLFSSANRGIEKVFNRDFSYHSMFNIDELKQLEVRWNSHIRFLDGKITDYCPYIAKTPAYTMNESAISLDKTLPMFYMACSLFNWLIKSFKGVVDVKFDLGNANPVCHITNNNIHAVMLLKKEL